MYRLGLIDYVNVAPINQFLPEQSPHYHITRGVPTAMNQALISGDIDLANISSFEFIQHADTLKALPDFSVSVLGAVYSVNLFHSVPWHELSGGRIALTTQSATSAKLLEVLLNLDGLNVHLERAEGTAFELLEQGYQGVLRIGDSALSEWYGLCGPLGEQQSMLYLPTYNQGMYVTDLAMRWFDHFGLPFAFAVWAYRSPPPPELVYDLRTARRKGLGHLAEVAQHTALKLNLPPRVVQHYLWNFRYHLEKPDKQGLQKFASLVHPHHAPLRFDTLP